MHLYLFPRWIRDKHAVTNVGSTGSDCFKWTVLAALHPVGENPSQLESYLPLVDRYDFDSLSFPVPLQSITPFAKRHGMTINVYGVEDDKCIIFPLCVTSSASEDGPHVDLLMHELGGTQHYSAIRNFSRLVSNQVSSHQHAVFLCRTCLHGCATLAALTKHMQTCLYPQHTAFPADPRCRYTSSFLHRL